MESILEDEDAIDKGIADKSKKRKPDDADRDEGPPAGSNQGLKKKKTSKDDEPLKKAKSSETFKGTTKSQPKSTGKSAQAEEIVFEDWFNNSERPATPDPEWNDCKIVDNKPTQKWLSDLAKAEKPFKTFDDLLSTLIDFSAFVMSCLQISKLTQDILIVPVDYFFNNDLACMQGGSTRRTYMTSLTKTKAANYDLLGIEDMVPNL
nr:hypothetical protein [Tanacetum cinerariifolium]